MKYIIFQINLKFFILLLIIIIIKHSNKINLCFLFFKLRKF